MKILQGFTILVGVATLAACSGINEFDEVKAVNEIQAVGSPFTQRLAAEYKNFANNELEKMGDHADALHFSRKGIAAASGDVVMPEPVSDWKLTPEHIAELGDARGRLVNAFDLGAREMQPELSAVAQARFDCWVEQQEENWQPEDINSCKTQFFDALQQIETTVAVQTPPPAPQPPVAVDVDASKPMQPENAMYLVFFDYDRTDIGTGATSILDAVAMEVKGRKDIKKVIVSGHADTTGSNRYNERLAKKRAEVVRGALVHLGVPESMIVVESHGESEPLVQTADNVREPANRRVQITFE